MKWDREQLLNILNLYYHKTNQHKNSQLIIWPEAAIPITASQAKPFIDLLNQFGEKNHSTLIFGVPVANPATHAYYNALMAVGQGHGVYYKRHLVPFGEYIPLHLLFNKVMRYFDIPMSTLTPGPSTQTKIRANHLTLGTFICYETAFPADVLNAAENTNLLISVSDDSWFGDSFASDQQLEMAQMRALETGRYMLYATNTGVTAIINPQGKIQARLPKNQRLALTGEVHAMTRKTPLMWWGYWPIFSLLLLTIIVISSKKWKK